MLIGRRTELDQLNRAHANGGFQLAVVSGRRHIGKTFLISEFVKDKPAVYFSAKEVNDRCNLDSFAATLRSEEHTSELQSRSVISFCVFWF